MPLSNSEKVPWPPPPGTGATSTVKILSRIYLAALDPPLCYNEGISEKYKKEPRMRMHHTQEGGNDDG